MEMFKITNSVIFSKILTVQQLRGTHERNKWEYKKAKLYSLSSQFINCSYSFVQHIVDVHIDSKQSMKAVRTQRS